jgi:hypothetical protein
MNTTSRCALCITPWHALSGLSSRISWIEQPDFRAPSATLQGVKIAMRCRNLTPDRGRLSPAGVDFRLSLHPVLRRSVKRVLARSERRAHGSGWTAVPLLWASSWRITSAPSS